MKRAVIAAAIAFGALLSAGKANAQVLPPPHRSQAWGTVSSVAAAIGGATQIVTPRIDWSDNETTLGWKPRWHVSQLMPVMTITALAFANEYAVKPHITSYRPGCGTTNIDVDGCTSFGMPSTHSFVAFAALGNGTAIFLVDSFKWSRGRISGPSLALNVLTPAVAAIFTAIGRGATTPAYEHGDQIAVGAGAGLLSGVVVGGVYAILQRPECGYGGGLVCW